MKIYLVGGAVRDQLLGLPIKDRDWVVVGATPEIMLEKGFLQVGKDFPVFLHPQTHEEYALARTERKTGQGHKAFDFSYTQKITLEEDLIRRDLTINAMAQDSKGKLHDPYNGLKDIEHHLLRHVSSAFSEDPLRVLRIMRFWARFYHLGFILVPETKALCQEMQQSGELSSLTVERVWQECEKALGYLNPEIFFEGLYEINALNTLGINDMDSEIFALHQKALIKAAVISKDTAKRLAMWIGQDRQLAQDMTETLKLPNRYQFWIKLVVNHGQILRDWIIAKAEDKWGLLKVCDAFKTTELLLEFCELLEISQEVRNHIVMQCKAIGEIHTQALQAEGFTGKKLGEELKRQQLLILQA